MWNISTSPPYQGGATLLGLGWLPLFVTIVNCVAINGNHPYPSLERRGYYLYTLVYTTVHFITTLSTELSPICMLLNGGGFVLNTFWQRYWAYPQNRGIKKERGALQNE